jgi:general stress protein CsbA
MRRVVRVLVPVTLAVFAFPGQALAAGRFTPSTLGVHVGLSMLGLVVAVVLLVEALGVRKLAFGGAVAERIGLVVLAVICLAASALAEWGTNFVIDLTLDQVQLASEVLVIAAMALLAAYFWTVRVGMKHYLVEVTAVPVADVVVPLAARRDDRA